MGAFLFFPMPPPCGALFLARKFLGICYGSFSFCLPSSSGQTSQDVPRLRMTSVFGFGNLAAAGFLNNAADGEGREESLKNVLSPRQLEFFLKSTLAPVSEIACGSQHTLFLLEDGSVYSCGWNDSCQLGNSSCPERSTEPSIISSLVNQHVVQIACGERHNLALTDEGSVYAWGGNDYGQLGIDHSSGHRPSIVNLPEVVQISCGANHSVVLCADGRLYSWGGNGHGQLGFGHTNNASRPININSLVGIPFRRIVCGKYFTCALSCSGAVFTWGCNQSGQLGLTDNKERQFPTQVKTLRYQRIVDIACGANHCVALTSSGGLFTFGGDAHGQLGHGQQTDDPAPRQVVELMGSKVARIACGSEHTLALINGRVYCFGLGASGQLGIGETKNSLTPTSIQSFAGAVKMFAGDDRSYVICHDSDQSLQLEPAPNPILPSNVKALRMSNVQELLKNGDHFKLISLLETVFSSTSCVNGSFLKQGYDHFGANKDNHGLDLDAAMETLQLLESHPKHSEFTQVIGRALEWSLLPELTPSPPDIEALRLYLVLPWFNGFVDNKDAFASVHVPFAQRLLSLNKVPSTVIGFWWSKLLSRHFGRLARIYRQLVSYVISLPQIYDHENLARTKRLAREQCLRVSLELLARLHSVNVASPKVPFDMFYVPELVDKIDIRQDYVQWLLSRNKNSPEKTLSFCNYPFIFDAAGKTLLLQTDAQVQMQFLVEQANRQNIQALFLPFSAQVSPYLALTINRERIVDDTVTQLLSQRSDSLKKPLKIQFAGEEADDVGGVKKEFFMLLFEELLHEKYAMFVENAESHELWFSGYDWVETSMYQVVGILCGLAIYNSVLVDFHFPLALYKKLLNEPVTLDDFKQLSPTEGRSLEQLIDYEGNDFESVFALTFELQVSLLDVNVSVELKPGGKDIEVTAENRQEYVQLYVQYKMETSVRKQFDAFADGFHRAVNSRILKFFQPQELMEMVAGNEQYDWDIFKMNTEYRGEYWLHHPTIAAFWQVFGQLNLEQKKKFLQFLTGSDRIPLLGMKQIKMTIQPAAPEYMPVAHTCFNLLDLPNTGDADVMKDKLLEAIEHNRGFSLV